MVMYFWERSASVWIALLYMVMGGLLLAFPAATSTVFVWAIMAMRAHTPDATALLLSSLIPLVLGAVIVVNPFQTVQLVVRIFGVGLIADGVADFAAVLTSRSAGTR